ncbi:hypothetical protein RUND412_003082 [Rhizina undulata]
MASAENELTHEEIWDDSMLVNAWDEALQEYKKYHSIQATGGDMKAILRDAEAEAEMQEAPPLVSQEDRKDFYEPSIEDGELEEEAGEYGESQQQEEKSRTIVPEVPSNEKIPPSLENSSLDVGSTNHEQLKQSTGIGEDAIQTPGQTPRHSHNQMFQLPPLPQIAVGSVDNEALRNLMMSWYYAGYYTGLYEGQQQQQKQQQCAQQQQPQHTAKASDYEQGVGERK